MKIKDRISRIEDILMDLASIETYETPILQSDIKKILKKHGIGDYEEV